MLLLSTLLADELDRPRLELEGEGAILDATELLLASTETAELESTAGALLDPSAGEASLDSIGLPPQAYNNAIALQSAIPLSKVVAND
ncbi:hypothetical protein [Idiomarina sp. UBA4206]|uniref:hypothetical protein n=1 Tax=Idiomarina sp. UBA4206 TaxID=1946644 RepID=UPI00257A9653|nr:hypothetical protein [Idiomarina sp. UBA4206]